MVQWTRWLEDNLIQFLAIIVAVICVIWIVSIFLSTIGKISLIRGASQAEGGAERLIFGQLFSESMPYFWRMLGLSLILLLPVFLIAMAVAITLVMGIAASGNGDTSFALLGILPLMLGCFCLLVPVMFVLGMIFRQAERAIVLEDVGVMPALSRGWDIFRANLGTIILMAIILAVIGFVVGIVVAIPIFIIVFPTMMAFIVGRAENTTPLIFMGICICLYLPVAILAQGIATAFTESAWTLTYMRLARGNQPKPDDNQPIEPEDSNKTLLASRPNA